MSLVVDASLTLAWYFEDERTPAVDDLLDRVVREGTIVPSLWRLEVVNGLQVAIRRGRIDAAYRDRALQQLGLLPITVDAETVTRAWTTTLGLADRFGLTLYDAIYLELAQRRALPLATLDRALRSAGRALGISLLGGTV
jgi:predicted nucleic acid-binding protein